MNFSYKTSLIIPTKNRHNDLLKAIISVINQVLQPNELIVIDQSDEVLHPSVIDSLPINNINIKYIHNKLITSLVHAKEVGSKIASGDIILFIDDDMELDKNYVYQIVLGFFLKKDMIACSGIESNTRDTSFIYRLFWSLFHRGIFQDNRRQIFRSYANLESGDPVFIKSNMISGGLSAWKKEVIRSVPFDRYNNFHMLEDIEYSVRVAEKYGPFLYINTSAKSKHFHTPNNRKNPKDKQSQKIYETIIFFKKRKPSTVSLLCCVWLLIGLFFETIFLSCKTTSIDPFFGYFNGVGRSILKKINYR